MTSPVREKVDLTMFHKFAPSDHSNDGGWWPDEVDLNTVTIGNMSIDSEPVETDGRRGRYREITVDSGGEENQL